MTDYPQKIQTAIDLATRHRVSLNKLLKQDEQYREQYDGETIPDEVLDAWYDLDSQVAVLRRKIDHIHKIIGQWLVDDIAGADYYPERD